MTQSSEQSPLGRCPGFQWFGVPRDRPWKSWTHALPWKRPSSRWEGFSTQTSRWGTFRIPIFGRACSFGVKPTLRDCIHPINSRFVYLCMLIHFSWISISGYINYAYWVEAKLNLKKKANVCILLILRTQKQK